MNGLSSIRVAIHPLYFATPLPGNCNDDDMEGREPQIPTVSSYTRTLVQSTLLSHLGEAHTLIVIGDSRSTDARSFGLAACHDKVNVREGAV